MTTSDGHKILIVEDSLTSQLMMEAQIHRREPDFAVFLRKSIKGCLEQLEKTGADVVILDMFLEDSGSISNPLETLEYISKIKSYGAKVMVCTADHLIDEDAVLAAGADAFYRKVIGANATTLISRIKALLPDEPSCSA